MPTPPSPHLLPLLSALLLTPSVLPAGDLLRVGPTRTYTQLQAAINAARTGDLILVDPGAYDPIDINGKGIAILGDATTDFRLIPRRGIPTVRVRNIPAGASVSILRWRTEVRYGETPSLLIERSTGAVRLKWASLVPVANLPSVAMRAIVRIVDADSVHFDTVSLAASRRFRASTTQGLAFSGGVNRGVSAIEAVRSRLHLVRCTMRGYDNLAGGEWAGDAVRLFGGAARIEESPTWYEGGNAITYGGSAVHWIGAAPGQDVLFCGRKFGRPIFTGGAAAFEGGRFAINHDRGEAGAATRNVPNCLADAVGHAEVATVMSLGGVYEFEISSLERRAYFAFVGPSDFAAFPGIEGKALLDYASAFTVTIGSGVLQASQNFVARRSVRVPRMNSLVGLQLATQAVIGPAVGSGRFDPIFTMADLILIVP